MVKHKIHNRIVVATLDVSSKVRLKDSYVMLAAELLRKLTNDLKKQPITCLADTVKEELKKRSGWLLIVQDLDVANKNGKL